MLGCEAAALRTDTALFVDFIAALTEQLRQSLQPVSKGAAAGAEAANRFAACMMMRMPWVLVSGPCPGHTCCDL
jgi:hypothetical protein